MEPAIICSIITGTATLLAAVIGADSKKKEENEEKRKNVKKISRIFTVFFLVCTVLLIIYGTAGGRISDDNTITNGNTIASGNTIVNGNNNTIVNGGIITNSSVNETNMTPTPTPTPTPAPTPKYPNPPSDDLLNIYGPGLHYPDESEYLSECETKYVAAPKGYSIFAYSSHRTDKNKIYEVRDGEEVTVLAVNKNNGFSCVIIESMQKAAWVNSTYLVFSPD